MFKRNNQYSLISEYSLIFHLFRSVVSFCKIAHTVSIMLLYMYVQHTYYISIFYIYGFIF